MNPKIGVKEAIEFLKEQWPQSYVPDDIHGLIGATIKADTMAHSLRRARCRGEVLVEYKDGVAFYHYNPEWGKEPTNNGEPVDNHNPEPDDFENEHEPVGRESI